MCECITDKVKSLPGWFQLQFNLKDREPFLCLLCLRLAGVDVPIIPYDVEVPLVTSCWSGRVWVLVS